jgi:DNA-binding transcriptional LysR family regulator
MRRIELDRIDAMRLFVRVADAGSFSRAAIDLELGQPTVSRRIQELEAALGSTLFQRTTRALSLTEAGQRFYRRAIDILADYDEAEAEARGLEHEPVGLLRLSCAASMGRMLLGPQVPGFLERYPHVRIDMMLDDTYTDLVGAGIDLAFRMGVLQDSSLMAKKLGDAPRALWASPAYVEKAGLPQSPGELSEHLALTFRQVAHTEWKLTRTNETASVSVDGRFKASSGEMLLQGAVAGLGILLGPNWLVREAVSRGELVRVLPEWNGDPSPLHAVWSAGKLRGKAKLFVEYLESRLDISSPC